MTQRQRNTTPPTVAPAMIGTFELLVAMICVGVEVLLAVGVDVGPGEEELELMDIRTLCRRTLRMMLDGPDCSGSHSESRI